MAKNKHHYKIEKVPGLKCNNCDGLNVMQVDNKIECDDCDSITANGDDDSDELLDYYEFCDRVASSKEIFISRRNINEVK